MNNPQIQSSKLMRLGLLRKSVKKIEKNLPIVKEWLWEIVRNIVCVTQAIFKTWTAARSAFFFFGRKLQKRASSDTAKALSISYNCR